MSCRRHTLCMLPRLPLLLPFLNHPMIARPRKMAHRQILVILRKLLSLQSTVPKRLHILRRSQRRRRKVHLSGDLIRTLLCFEGEEGLLGARRVVLGSVHPRQVCCSIVGDLV